MVARSAGGDEQIVVVPTQLLAAAGLRDGFHRETKALLAAAFAPGAARLLPRALAEADERFKQVICYVVLLYGCQVFNYRRSGRAGEARLAGLRSIGLGGHLNAADAAPVQGRAALDRAIRRELAEEVAIVGEPRLRIVGVINDNSSPVGRVHLGLVVQAQVASTQVTLRDDTLADGRFDLVRDLVERESEFETWSRLCLPALTELVPP